MSYTRKLNHIFACKKGCYSVVWYVLNSMHRNERIKRKERDDIDDGDDEEG